MWTEYAEWFLRNNKNLCALCVSAATNQFPQGRRGTEVAERIKLEEAKDHAKTSGYWSQGQNLDVGKLVDGIRRVVLTKQ